MSIRYQTKITEITAEVVAAFVVHNAVRLADLPGLIGSVHAALGSLGKPMTRVEEPAKLVPPVSIKKSITEDYLISMEDGKGYKSLKRHLAKHGLTPAEYRLKWGLPDDYPMIAPTYASRRSEIAKMIGLGRARREALEKRA